MVYAPLVTWSNHLCSSCPDWKRERRPENYKCGAIVIDILPGVHLDSDVAIFPRQCTCRRQFQS
ncbi:hypothetical protein ACKS0A_07762 [Histoplasma ohiense]